MICDHVSIISVLSPYKEATMDASVVLEVLENLSKAPLFRSMLYLNIDRIKDLYHQSGGLDTIEIREDLTSDIAGGLNVAVAKIGSKLSRKEGNSRQLDISPLLMAILLEEDKKRNDLLLDPSVDIPLKKGPCSNIRMGDK
jgi:hypothetical protein